jgi:sugar diacid utilization regulator
LEPVAADCGVLMLTVVAPAGAGPLHRAYDRAATLLRLARNVAAGPRLLDAADLRLHSLLVEGTPDHEQFVDEVLGPILRLPRQQRDKLLDTVSVLCRTSLRGGLRAVAKGLDVHEKTVAYRVERVMELTGMDLDHPGHRAQFVAAVELLRLGD